MQKSEVMVNCDFVFDSLKILAHMDRYNYFIFTVLRILDNIYGSIYRRRENTLTRSVTEVTGRHVLYFYTPFTVFTQNIGVKCLSEQGRPRLGQILRLNSKKRKKCYSSCQTKLQS